MGKGALCASGVLGRPCAVQAAARCFGKSDVFTDSIRTWLLSFSPQEFFPGARTLKPWSVKLRGAPAAAWRSCQSACIDTAVLPDRPSNPNPTCLLTCRRPVRCLAFLGEDLVAAGGAGGGVILLQRGEAGAWEPRQALHGNIDTACPLSHCARGPGTCSLLTRVSAPYPISEPRLLRTWKEKPASLN